MKRPLKGAWRWVLIVVLLIVLVDFIVFPINLCISKFLS